MKSIKCCKCEILYHESNFYRDKSRPNGFKPRCKPCDKLSLDRTNRKEYEKLYRQKNPLKRKEIVKKSFLKNINHHRAVLAVYRTTESFYRNSRNHTAEYRARQTPALIEKFDCWSLFNSSNRQCFYCDAPITFKETEFDHFIPLSKGGDHKLSNIRVSCARCNRSKGASMPQEVSYQMV